MKKSTILIILFFISCMFCTHAQARPGVKLGVNSSNISNTRLDTKSGLYIGAFVNIPITEYYALQPEVLYSGQGGKSNSPEYGDVEINYLSIVLPNKFYVAPNKGFHFILGAGLDINIENNPISLTNGNSNFEISPLDVFFFGGIGYEFGFGLSLEARYKQGTASTDFFGINDLYEKEGGNFNTVFQIGVAYKFKIK